MRCGIAQQLFVGRLRLNLHKHPGETREHQILQGKMKVMFKASSVGRTIIGIGRLFKLMFLAVTSSKITLRAPRGCWKVLGFEILFLFWRAQVLQFPKTTPALIVSRTTITISSRTQLKCWTIQMTTTTIGSKLICIHIIPIHLGLCRQFHLGRKHRWT